MKKITETAAAIFLWKRVELIHSIDFPNNLILFDEVKKILGTFSGLASVVMRDYQAGSTDIATLVVARETLRETLYNEGPAAREINSRLNRRYEDCGAHWSAGGRGCCATAGATALINPSGEIFAYRLGWSDSMGQNGNSEVFPASEIDSITEALDRFNHFSGESSRDTSYRLLPREDWNIVVSRWKRIQQAKKIRLDAEARMVWRTGAEFSFGITTRGGWYKPSAGVGEWKIVPQHEHDDSRTRLGKMKISPKVPYGMHYLYIWGYPIALYLQEGQEPSLSLCASSHWANSQNWGYDHHFSTSLQPGWIFVDGEDVYLSTKEKVDANRAEQVATRNAKFAEAKAKAIEAGFTEAQIGQIIKLAQKGKVIQTIFAAVRLHKYGSGLVLQIVKDLRGEDPVVMENYIFLVANAAKIRLSSAERAAEKAGAWAYLNALIPGYGVGYFDHARTALSLALANGVPFKNGNNKLFGGENAESDLAVKLREAGLVQ